MVKKLAISEPKLGDFKHFLLESGVQLRVLELCCGTKSFSKEFDAYGHKTLTVDWCPTFKPDICQDLMLLSSNDFVDFKPHIVWASLPCNKFSIASFNYYWFKDDHGNYCPKDRSTDQALKLVEHTIRMIKELNPIFWFIENPQGMMRHVKVMQSLERYRRSVTYCQYGFNYRKLTDIWTNCSFWHPKKPCNKGDPCHSALVQRLKDYKTRYAIPSELCKEIMFACIDGLNLLRGDKL